MQILKEIPLLARYLSFVVNNFACGSLATLFEEKTEHQDNVQDNQDNQDNLEHDSIIDISCDDNRRLSLALNSRVKVIGRIASDFPHISHVRVAISEIPWRSMESSSYRSA